MGSTKHRKFVESECINQANSDLLMFYKLLETVILGFKKKVKKQMAYKGNELLKLWMRPMVTHMYHCVQRCEDPELLRARWLSMEHHITNEVRT